MLAGGDAIAADPGRQMLRRALRSNLPDGMRSPATAGARNDTAWFGGLGDGGLAMEGGLWDFDTDLHGDPSQGWTSRDLTTDVGVRFGRVTAADFAAPDPYVPMLAPVPPATENIGQLWVGIHQDEADLRDFVAGMGYSNYQCQRAISASFAYAGEAIDIQFNYFLQSEPDCDGTYIYVLCYDDGSLVFTDLVEYMDGISPGGDSLGTYNWESPQLFEESVPCGGLPAETDEIRLEIRFRSDGGWSDEDGLWITPAGPLGVDNISIAIGGSIVGDYDFEVDEEGWAFEVCPGIGSYMGIVPEETYSDWIAMSGLPCGCAIQGNAVELVDEVNSPYSPPGHPHLHFEMAISNVVHRDSMLYPLPQYNTTLLAFDNFVHLAYGACTFYRYGYMVYPYTSAVNPNPHWSPRLGPNEWQHTGDDPFCGGMLINLTTLGGESGDPCPAGWDSLRICYEIGCDWEYFGVPPDV
jgi:hypothetical protein